MKRILCIILLCAAVLALTACHVDNDPWVNLGVITVATTATPTTEQMSNTRTTESVPTTVIPTQQPAVMPETTDWFGDEPNVTLTPGGEEAPGVNG